MSMTVMNVRKETIEADGYKLLLDHDDGDDNDDSDDNNTQ
jgi:hypothetical protein